MDVKTQIRIIDGDGDDIILDVNLDYEKKVVCLKEINDNDETQGAVFSFKDWKKVQHCIDNPKTAKVLYGREEI